MSVSTVKLDAAFETSRICLLKPRPLTPGLRAHTAGKIPSRMPLARRPEKSIPLEISQHVTYHML